MAAGGRLEGAIGLGSLFLAVAGLVVVGRRRLRK
jgi:hypothetical protein